MEILDFVNRPDVFMTSVDCTLQFLSMKLATLNPRLDFNVDNIFAKEVNISVIFPLFEYYTSSV